MRKILSLIGLFSLGCLIGWFSNDYYSESKVNAKIKQLKEEQKQNEKALIDSLLNVPIDTLAFRQELRARQRLNKGF